ncbi:Endonuclease 2 [Apostasia shenzhenica]|uniref:Aspergillus nuclease S1 n=1 Tax=Apostasia shenzhenica TaxID=1088818 RepID=A0A2I0AHW5_9ASPA|nr:Endonuclease 2 [Apostasia shenzhenica]
MGLASSLHLFFFLFSISISRAPFGNSWGKEGHIMVCKIAESYLTEKTRKAVAELLPETAGGDFPSVCPWADEVRFRYHWSSPLHYINTPGVCNYKYSRDCHNSKGVMGMCVVGAINNYTGQLLDCGDLSNQYNLTESLMFLVHFVGDVHQPLHVGFEADEGGNTIIVRWYRRKTNLHHVWDVSMIETAMKYFYNDNLDTMVKGIQLNITGGWSDEINSWENCQNKRATCANDYAVESMHLACNYAYKDVEQGSTLEDEYFLTRLPILKKRIAQAGVRLALILNRIFDSSNGQEIQSL